MRRYPVTFTPLADEGRASDFGLTDDATGNDTTPFTVGATVRHLNNAERANAEFEVNQDVLEVTCHYSPSLALVTPIKFTATFQGIVYEVLRRGEGEFDNRTIRFLIGRNA